MKYPLLAILLILILGAAGFLYRQKIMSFFSISDTNSTFFYLPQAFQAPEARRLAEAVVEGDVEEVVRLLPSVPGGINVLGRNNETVLLLATERLNLPMVKALLNLGADPNGGPDRAPLAMAVRAYDLSIANLLLEFGADPNGKIGAEPALYKAALVGADDAIDLLIQFKARVDEPDGIGSPSSFAAAGADHWVTVDKLIKHGASLWAVNQAGFTLGTYASASRLSDDGDQGRSRNIVISKLRESGFPWPPPSPSEVMSKMAAGAWPPKTESL